MWNCDGVRNSVDLLDLFLDCRAPQVASEVGGASSSDSEGEATRSPGASHYRILIALKVYL